MSDVSPIIENLEKTQLRKNPMPEFRVGDTVRVWVLIKEGDKERRERIVIGPALVPAVTPPPSESAPSSPPGASSVGMSTQKLLGLVAGGVGVAGLALGTVFGVMTLSEASQQQTDCASATNCMHYPQAASDHSTGATDRTISTVGFIAGGLLLAGGAVLFFTAGHPSERAAATGLLVVPSVVPGGGEMLLKGDF